jgi:hypothetical protein
VTLPSRLLSPRPPRCLAVRREAVAKPQAAVSLCGQSIEIRYLVEWPAAKSPRFKRQKVSLGWAYRIYIDGMYMGTGLTQASARDGAKRMLVIYEKIRSDQPDRAT